MDNKTKVLTSIVEYLQGLKADGADADNIDTITSLLQEEFGLEDTAAEFENNSYYPVDLSAIFQSGVNTLKLKRYGESLTIARNNPKFESFVEVVSGKGYFEGTEPGSPEYLKRHAKLIEKFASKAATITASEKGVQERDEAAEKEAEDLKFKGNAAINAKDYDEAVRLYTQALEKSSNGPNSHVYHSNRAAANCHLNKYQEAVEDCQICLSMEPTYVKAYSRLGLSYFFLGRYEDAVEAYEKAVELEPDNKQSQDSLRQARNKLRKQAKSKATSVAADEGVPGLPPGIANNPNMKKAIDQMGGSAGIAKLMQDPQMMSMAQQMMKDPAMMQQAMSMLGGGGGGGMPDLSALAGMMGGMGSGQAPSSSSSSSGRKQPFKGFED